MTKIEWTDETWNPTRGCSMAKGSETGGCLNCYAARDQLRRLKTVSANGKPFAIMTENGPRWTGKVELMESKLTEPLHWKTPRRVFVNSMSDLFHPDLPWAAIDRVWQVMLDAPQHTYQILTKRPDVMLEYLKTDTVGGRAHFGTIPDWIWLGVSVEDQPTADARIPLLLQTPAAVRFVSYEPALAAVDFSDYMWPLHWHWAAGYPTPQAALAAGAYAVQKRQALVSAYCPFLDWVIVGGESGPDARPFDIEWARSTIRQCKAAGAAVFVKQLGARPYQGSLGDGRMPELALTDRKGGDWDEWPADLRVRELARKTLPESIDSNRKELANEL